MTRAEAIKIMEQRECCMECVVSDFTCKDCDTAFEMAIKALERTEPQWVFYSGDGYADGYMVYDIAECPNCGYEYEDGDKDWGLPFCSNCGQALKWEVEHEQRED